MCFFTFCGYYAPEGGGGVSNKIPTQTENGVFTLGSSNIEVFKTYILDPVICQTDLLEDVKHVLGSIFLFFTLFGYWVWGGVGWVLPHDWYTAYLCTFSPWTAQKLKFSKLLFC